MTLSYDPPLKRAELSDCGRYRYSLGRTWTPGLPVCVFVMLNPSTANAHEDDPTIRRCIGYARAWDCGALTVVNLTALRSTDPDALPKTAHVDPMNDTAIVAAVRRHDVRFVICAWGAHRASVGPDRRALALISRAGAEPMALRFTKSGAPSHPLYLPASLRPIPFPLPTTSGDPRP